MSSRHVLLSSARPRLCHGREIHAAVDEFRAQRAITGHNNRYLRDSGRLESMLSGRWGWRWWTSCWREAVIRTFA